MMDQPSALELVTAVREFIEKHAMPELQGRTAFHARVAANALAIVARELEHGPAANAEEHARLKALLGRDGSLDELNRELCRRGSAGKFLTDDQLYSRLSTTAARLDEMSTRLAAGQGTAGMLLQDRQLYENMSAAVTELRGLVSDIRKDPKRYLNVKVSLF